MILDKRVHTYKEVSEKAIEMVKAYYAQKISGAPRDEDKYARLFKELCRMCDPGHFPASR
jgi:hypothetical protein